MGYCPLDLYSGQPERVTKALHALWDVWISTSGGVNNLKVFVEGHQIKPTSDVRLFLVVSPYALKQSYSQIRLPHLPANYASNWALSLNYATRLLLRCFP